MTQTPALRADLCHELGEELFLLYLPVARRRDLPNDGGLDGTRMIESKEDLSMCHVMGADLQDRILASDGRLRDLLLRQDDREEVGLIDDLFALQERGNDELSRAKIVEKRLKDPPVTID